MLPNMLKQLQVIIIDLQLLGSSLATPLFINVTTAVHSCEKEVIQNSTGNRSTKVTTARLIKNRINIQENNPEGLLGLAR